MTNGYAPGDYTIICHKCGKHKTGMDKRAITCKECAVEGDDAAATSPKAKAELEALREQVRRLKQELDYFRSQHTHDCIRCRHQYTPKEGESEDCPVCGCDGTLENEVYKEVNRVIEDAIFGKKES